MRAGQKPTKFHRFPYRHLNLNITIALRADGTGVVIHGPEVPLKQQQQTVQQCRNTDVPEGFVRVEIWNRQCVKFAYKQDERELRRRELDAQIAADKVAGAASAES